MLPAAAEGTDDLDVSAIVPAARANAVRIHVGLFVVTLTEMAFRLHSHSGAPRGAQGEDEASKRVLVSGVVAAPAAVR